MGNNFGIITGITELWWNNLCGWHSSMSDCRSLRKDRWSKQGNIWCILDLMFLNKEEPIGMCSLMATLDVLAMKWCQLRS